MVRAKEGDEGEAKRILQDDQDRAEGPTKALCRAVGLFR